LKSVSNVDEIIPYETEGDLRNLLATLAIDVRVLGSDYEGRPVTGEDICQMREITILYAPRLHNFSSTELRSRLGRVSI
jgi:glycerol-3-phosphate cytidylyltransferase